jgi:hypothetical protein
METMMVATPPFEGREVVIIAERWGKITDTFRLITCA